MLACRLCRVPMTALAGCAVCDAWRGQLVVVGEDEEDRPSLAGTAAEMVSVLRAQGKHVKVELERNRASALHEKRALALANTLAKLLESARKLQADGAAAVAQMSFQERKELFVSWYTDLAPQYRNAVREAFAQYEADVARPLRAPSGEELTS